MGAYSVVFAPGSGQTLAKLPLTVRGAIRHRMNEIAIVADSVAAGVETGGAPGGDHPGSSYALELAGYMVSYVIKDASRTLTVLSIAPI